MEEYIKNILPLKINDSKLEKVVKEYEKYEKFTVGKLDARDHIEKNMVLLGISRTLFTHSLPLVVAEQCYMKLLKDARCLVQDTKIAAKREKAYSMLLTLIEDYNIRLLATKVYWDNPKDREQFKRFHEKYKDIEKLKEITSNLTNLDYDIYSYQEYLEDIINNNLKIEFTLNDNSDDTVKIMTIHASKGLEFNICYYGGLYSKFNIREAISKCSYDDKYGIIIPYKDNFLYNTIYHTLSYRNYVKENISERIRLFYVALTRAKQKMIFLLPENNKEETYINDLVDNSIREKYNSFASIMYSLEYITKKYYTNIDIKNINLSKNYNMVKNGNYKALLNKVEDILEVNNININALKEEEKTFSKKNIHLITKEEESKLDYGKKIHELFELTDFNNTSNLTGKNKEIITNFLDKVDIGTANVYKEYEFIYEDNNITYHGIIDLMLEYDNNIKIIDYKLKNINDSAYLKQLNGYKNYIENIFNKDTSIYLYSILDNTLEKV